MITTKLKPNDPRVKYESAEVRGKTYSYILGEPQGVKHGTVFLLHGFPDFSFGWRYQIPYLMSLGFQVVAPNMLGYPGSDCPRDISFYSLKSMSDDVRELARKFVGDDGQIILGAHDWGGALAWRIGYWHPTLIKALFVACVPPWAPSHEYIDLKTLIKNGKFVSFKYQLQSIGPEPQSYFQGKKRLRQFFQAMYLTRCSDGKWPFTMDHGIHFDRLENLAGESRILRPDELDHYVESFSKLESPELEGAFNWYRNRKLIHDEELERLRSGHPYYYEMPVLYFCATKDGACPPSMSVGIEKWFANLTQKELNTTHWIMAQAPEEFNATLGKWLDVVYTGKPKALL